MRRYPAPYLRVPEFLEPVAPPPSAAEIARATDVRAAFCARGEVAPYMVDVVRAFRLLRGKRRYVEIGTFDKGCLAYASTQLSPEATLVDVDVRANPDASAHLARVAKPEQRIVTVVGDSTHAETLDTVRSALGGEPADCVFVDGNHTAQYCWADYCNYAEMLTPGGLMFFHDIYWQGAVDCFGVSQAAEQIDRVQPLYVVFADHPVHRFLPWLVKEETVWGGVGILKA